MKAIILYCGLLIFMTMGVMLCTKFFNETKKQMDAQAYQMKDILEGIDVKPGHNEPMNE